MYSFSNHNIAKLQRKVILYESLSFKTCRHK